MVSVSFFVVLTGIQLSLSVYVFLVLWSNFMVGMIATIAVTKC